MRPITATLLAVALVTVFALTAGCTGTDEMTHLRIGYQPSTHQIAHITAMEKGWWQEDLAPLGITKVTDYQFGTGPPEMQAMLAGDLDIAYVGAAPFVSALASGLDAKIVASVQTQGSDLMLRTNIAYEGPQDLEGLTIATYPPGSIQDTILRPGLRRTASIPRRSPSSPWTPVRHDRHRCQSGRRCIARSLPGDHHSRGHGKDHRAVGRDDEGSRLLCSAERHPDPRAPRDRRADRSTHIRAMSTTLRAPG